MKAMFIRYKRSVKVMALRYFMRLIVRGYRKDPKVTTCEFSRATIFSIWVNEMRLKVYSAYVQGNFAYMNNRFC